MKLKVGMHVRVKNNDLVNSRKHVYMVRYMYDYKGKVFKILDEQHPLYKINDYYFHYKDFETDVPKQQNKIEKFDPANLHI
jgi:hypothetical protein